MINSDYPGDREAYLRRLSPGLFLETNIPRLLQLLLECGVGYFGMDSAGVILFNSGDSRDSWEIDYSCTLEIAAAYPGAFFYGDGAPLRQVLEIPGGVTWNIASGESSGQAWADAGFTAAAAAPLTERQQTMGIIHFHTSRRDTSSTVTDPAALTLFIRWASAAVCNARRHEKNRNRLKFLEASHNELEKFVLKRAAELENVNHSLEMEISERRKLESALKNQSARLEERLKELHCLYAVSQLAVDADLEEETLFIRALEAIRENWHTPDKTAVRIIIMGGQYATENWNSGAPILSADIEVDKIKVGILEVGYLENIYLSPDGDWLEEDRKLIHALAALLGEYVQRKLKEEEINGYKGHLEEMVRLRTAELEQFVFVASHDLQEPLRKIQAFCDRLICRTASSLDEKGAFYMERIIHNAGVMRHLLDDLTLYAQVIKKVRTFKRINPRNLFQRIISDAATLVSEKQAVFHLRELPALWGDEWRIRELFRNIISNALKFSKEDVPPNVRIEALPVDENFVDIVVADNGIGFDERYAARIFKPFQRLHCKDEYHGTGMGLSVCKKIVEQHGGVISVRSTPGEGSSFSLRLPLYSGSEHDNGEDDDPGITLLVANLPDPSGGVSSPPCFPSEKEELK